MSVILPRPCHSPTRCGLLVPKDSWIATIAGFLNSLQRLPFTSGFLPLTRVCLSQGTDRKRRSLPTGTLCESLAGDVGSSAYIPLRNSQGRYGLITLAARSL